ncbi:hypothetical protein Celaphus_00016773, partial [Cervus elaphus hippelaphus]
VYSSGLEGKDHNLSNSSVAVPRRCKSDSDIERWMMVKRGTYSEFLKSKVDIFSLFEKGNKQSEPSPVPGTPTVISESLGQSLQSPRPSLKDVAQDDQDITLPLEDHLEGKVGFKTYENYFTASADWPVIIFLLLVNIAAQ